MEQFWNTRTDNLGGLLVLSYEYERELIRRAESGDQEASRLILEELISHIDRKSFESPAFDYLASNLRLFLEEGIPLERALGIEADVNRGGRPRKYDDTEVAAGYISNKIFKGNDLETTLKDSLKYLDGFYTFIAGNKDGIALLRDEIACKPAVVAENEDYVAIASEFQAMAHLPDINEAKIFEPEPGIVYSWGN